MKTIVSIIGGYAPDFSPGGKIASNVLDELKKDYDVTIIAQKTKFGLPEYEEINGIKLIRVPDYNLMLHSLFETKIKASSGIVKSVYKALLFGKKAVNYAVRMMRRRSLSGAYIRRLDKCLKKIEKETKIDILIPASAPHEALAAAVKYKKKHPATMLIPYKLDRFAQGNSLYENSFIRKFRYPRHIQSEQETLIYADAMFALPPIADYYEKSEFEFKEKVVKTEHPLLKKVNIEKSAEESERISLVYAGSLDTTLRNPEYLLEMFSKTPEFKEKYIFNIYSFGNCGHILDSYKKILEQSMNDAGKIPSDKVAEKLFAADILVTIGNNSSEEVPSKLFEYLSYGKPIVHFYYNDNDAYIKYLKDYDMSICLKMDEDSMDDNIEKFKSFCENNKGKTIDFEEVKKHFEECTPEYTAKQFDDAIKRVYTSNFNSVVVAHPNQQHSMKLATALKKANLLHSYVTTVFYSKNSALGKLLQLLGPKFSAKLNRKRNPYLEPDAKVLCGILGYIYYFLMRVSYGISCKVYIYLTKRFGKKIAKYVKKNNCRAVIMYDYTAAPCFEVLAKEAPEVVRILDVSSIPATSIYEIISAETEKGYGKYFEKSMQRYKKQYCDYFAKEIAMAQYFLSPSTFVDSHIVKNGGNHEKIYRTEYGTNLSDFTYELRSAEEDEVINFVFTGRMEGAKGIFYLLDACDSLYQERKDFTLHLVGPNNIGDELLKPREYLKWYGWMEKAKLVELYKKMHVFVLPSLWEGMSQSTLEAVMSGMGVICSDRAGVSDRVLEKGAAVIVPAADADKLKEAMKTILNNKADVQKLSECCSLADVDMSWDNYYNTAAQNVLDIFADVENHMKNR